MKAFVEIKLVSPPTKEPVQLIDAELQIGNELNFVQKMMKEWFYSSALASIIIIMFWLFVGIRTIHYLFNKKRSHRRSKREREGLYMDPDAMEEVSQGVSSCNFDDVCESDIGHEDHDSFCWEECKHSGEDSSQNDSTGESSQHEKIDTHGMRFEENQNMQQKKERIRLENLMKDKVMRGDLDPFEIFTGEYSSILAKLFSTFHFC